MSAELARAIRETLISPNENDRNMKDANIVDALFSIARAIDHLAKNVATLEASLAESFDRMTGALATRG